MELTNDDIQDQLRSLGKAEIPLEGTTVNTARGRLIGAAKFVGVRVSVTRDTAREVMVATVLTSDEAAAQARRSARFRAARQIKQALEILVHEQDAEGLEATKDLMADLGEIVAELEEQ